MEEAIKTLIQYVIENKIEPLRPRDDKCVDIAQGLSVEESQKGDCC
jgi:hypothetical protein